MSHIVVHTLMSPSTFVAIVVFSFTGLDREKTLVL